MNSEKSASDLTVLALTIFSIVLVITLAVLIAVLAYAM